MYTRDRLKSRLNLNFKFQCREFGGELRDFPFREAAGVEGKCGKEGPGPGFREGFP